MSDDDPAEESGDPEDAEETELVPEVSAEDLDTRLDETAEALEAAETEADLDDVEADLDDIEEDLERAELPEPDEDDEDAEDPREELESRLSDQRDDLEEQRGPYASDVVDDIESARATIADTRWTEAGEADLPGVVDEFLAAVTDALDADLDRTGDDDLESLADALDDAVAAVEDADLDADEDADTIAALLEATDALETGVDDAEEWDDLETHEQLQAQGFYDVLGHYKDFPPELAALKEHEQQGNVEMVLLALDSLQSEFMEEHCLDALTRMNDEGAFEAMHQRAQKRDQPAIRALGKMAAENAVETLVEYVDSDSNPALQKVTFKALGEIGHADAVQPLANKLAMDNDEVRPYAARALGLIGDARAVDPLADAAADDESDNVRAAALWALRQIGTEDALEAAAEFDDDRAFIVQTEAEKARDALDAAGEGEEVAA
ncbi:HEAT repeat domain-containing protein [Halobaculum magnesiiphilum]|uniref:HEAT repeat domain-containing protein n=1 Tax=Halobaculum magnesiiphilum TaxID=1017351 RepID=A0A8T8WDJ0_9EURY|nr:HEAT repeat domain-containing protein [Halobaculum magnesiiphilum]QZP37919.1 HEAT repeat domain-containing protein [Halobaculum magnesiiphilum]